MRSRRGQVAAVSGQMAEEAVARLYQRRGATVLETRWRGTGAEIDLILRDGPDVVFVEVKAAATHAAAAQRILPAQMGRIMQAAQEYCGQAGLGQDAPMRFDAALVDEMGRIDLIPNAFDAT
ncbi:YraN family protein [Paracoccus sp. R86501]|uniref:YraN family protein n=1 Tax=Paracoccus sp. R86501 TaxID=3101711 RepID=UPI0036721271